MWGRCDVGTMTRQPRERGIRRALSRLVGAPALIAGQLLSGPLLAGPLLAGPLLALPLAMIPGPAAADFRLCNNTSSRVGISVGYKENEGWTTDSWWNLSARTCQTMLRGALVAR